MAKLLSLPPHWRKKGMTTFTRHEIGMLMSIYGEKVSKNEWRDYALDCLPDMAVFSIFRHSHEQPVYSIVKIVTKGNRSSKFTVSDGERVLKESKSLLEALQVFKEGKKKK
jgi:hypothetical protein